MKKRNFFIPNVDHWRWERIERRYVRQMYDRSSESLVEIESALAQLDGDMVNIEQEIKGVWASASATMMRAFEGRLLDVRLERWRIVKQRTKLLGVMDRMRAYLNESKAINV